MFLKASVRKCVLQSVLHEDTEQSHSQTNASIPHFSCSAHKTTPWHHRCYVKYTDDTVLTWHCSTNSSSIIPDSESDVFWYRMSYSTDSFTSQAQLLPLWHNSRLLSTLRVCFHWHDFCQQSSPGVYITPGYQMWTSVTVFLVFFTKLSFFFLKLLCIPTLLSRCRCHIDLLCGEEKKKISVKNDKTENRLSAEYKKKMSTITCQRHKTVMISPVVREAAKTWFKLKRQSMSEKQGRSCAAVTRQTSE